MRFNKPKHEWVTVRAKIKKGNYIELDNHCKSSNTTVSSYIRTLIEKEKPGETSIKKAGSNFFVFNPLDDKFIWEIRFDNGSKSQIAEDLSDGFLENLKVSIEKALALRNENIQKQIEGSVMIPTKITRLKGGGGYVKS